MANRFAAIILAAGFSRRMTGFKPLLPLGRETITDRLMTVFAENHVDVYLVTGWRQDELQAGIRAHPVQIVFNPDFPKGMFTSVQAGLRSLKDGYQAFFVQPVDIPLIRNFTIRSLIAAADEQPEKIIYPVFGARRGHPPLIPASLVPSILAWPQAGGLKSFLAARAADTLAVPVPDANVLFDIDTPVDYQALLERWQNYTIPNAAECEVILKDVCRVSTEIYRHCQKVAQVAGLIGRALSRAGVKPDSAVIHAAAMLHDVARAQTGHAATGAWILHEMGFTGITEAVAMHTDLMEGRQAASLEDKVVYLADKYVKDAAIATLEERYASAIERHGADHDIVSQIEKRRARAFEVREELTQILGYPLENIIHFQSR